MCFCDNLRTQGCNCELITTIPYNFDDSYLTHLKAMTWTRNSANFNSCNSFQFFVILDKFFVPLNSAFLKVLIESPLIRNCQSFDSWTNFISPLLPWRQNDVNWKRLAEKGRKKTKKQQECLPKTLFIRRGRSSLQRKSQRIHYKS